MSSGCAGMRVGRLNVRQITTRTCGAGSGPSAPSPHLKYVTTSRVKPRAFIFGASVDIFFSDIQPAAQAGRQRRCRVRGVVGMPMLRGRGSSGKAKNEGPRTQEHACPEA